MDTEEEDSPTLVPKPASSRNTMLATGRTARVDEAEEVEEEAAVVQVAAPVQQPVTDDHPDLLLNQLVKSPRASLLPLLPLPKSTSSISTMMRNNNLLLLPSSPHRCLRLPLPPMVSLPSLQALPRSPS